MKKILIDERILIGKNINSLGLSDGDRKRALAALAKADAVVSAFFTAWRFLKLSPRPEIARPKLKAQ